MAPPESPESPESLGPGPGADPDPGESARPVRITIKDRVLTATVLNPYVEVHRGAAIARDVRAAMARPGKAPCAVVLDMTYVDFVNSSGLGELADLAMKMPEGVICIVYGANEELAHVLHLVKLDRLFTVANDAAELKKALGGA